MNHKQYVEITNWLDEAGCDPKEFWTPISGLNLIDLLESWHEHKSGLVEATRTALEQARYDHCKGQEEDLQKRFFHLVEQILTSGDVEQVLDSEGQDVIQATKEGKMFIEIKDFLKQPKVLDIIKRYK
jgi:hypothetical protein